jgi:hypothetical protein
MCKQKCVDGKCMLKEINTEDNDNNTCINECYLAKESEWIPDHIDWYKKKYPKEYYKCFYTVKELRQMKLEQLCK